MKKKFVKARGWKKLLCASLAVALFTCGMFSNYAMALYDEWKLGHRLKGDKDFVFTPYEGFSSATIAQINHAFYEWNKYLPSGVHGVKREPTLRHNLSVFPNRDGRNLIYRCNEGPGFLGATYRRVFNYDGTLLESDIVANTYYNFANSGIADHYDIYSLFVHEAGHVLGFADMDDGIYTSSIMCETLPIGVEKRSVTEFEQIVLRDIYK